MFMLSESASNAVNVNYVARFVCSCCPRVRAGRKCELCSQFRMFMLSENESKAVNVNYVASFVCSCCPRVRARQ